MPTYAIGDVQGCYDELQSLLKHIQFNQDKDQLWFAGDLVNRGHQSLQVLRFIHKLPNAVVVLGNHDIHLLALANGHPYSNHTLQDVLKAPDYQQLVNWLRKQPLLHYDLHLNYLMTHAGIFPSWSLTQAQNYAHEVEMVLQRDDYANYLEQLEGTQPDRWNEHLSGVDRLRFIVNVFTRMRFCTLDGRLDFKYTGKVGTQPADFLPWFQVPNRAVENIPIVFGHWAALEGQTFAPDIFGLDTGCAWGKSLTAMRLEDRMLFSVPSKIR